MAFLSFWHGYLSCEKTLTARSMEKTGIFAGYSFPCKNKDKLDGLYILHMLHPKAESTVILHLPGERNNKSDFFPKIWQIIKVYLYSSTAKRQKLSNACSLCVQFYKQFPKTCVHFLMYFLQADFMHVVLVQSPCYVANFHTKNVCNAVKWLITRNR